MSQLSHVEIKTPTPQESLDFFTDVLGLQVSHRGGQSVWLRAWGPRARRAAAPRPRRRRRHHRQRRRARHGVPLHDARRASLELVWDVERYAAPAGQRSAYPDRPQEQVAHNATVRRLDHCTAYTPHLLEDRRILTSALRFRPMETTVTPAGDEVFSTLTSGAHNHDYALIAQAPGMPVTGGRLNHFCFYFDARDELLRGLDLLAEHGFKLEFSPHRHGIGELLLCYVFEPGGNRVELQTGGYRNFIPDWEPVTWQLEQGGNLAPYVAQMPEPGSPRPRTAVEGEPAPAQTFGPR